MKNILITIFLFSLFSCGKMEKFEAANEFSSLFKLTVEDDLNKVVTLDEFGKKLSEVNFSSPYKRVILLNTTYSSYIIALAEQERVAGMVDLDRCKGFEEIVGGQKVKNVGKSPVLNIELISSLKPDLIICSSFQVKDLSMFSGVDVLVINEFWESHPLGRMEWVKVFGVLFGAQERAGDLYSKTVARYQQQLRNKQENIPSTYSLSRFSSEYFIPGCESLLPKLLTDAQSHVECIKKTSKSVQISQEEQLSLCGNKDYLLFFDWLLISRTYDQVLKELSVEDCFKGEVIYCNTSSNNYFEASIMEPDVVLGNLFDILHRGKKETKYFTLLK
jgi:iron complex transport system substrate-binding protein